MTKTKLFLAFLLLIFIDNVSEAQIVINEISNKNSGQIGDEDGELNDWIELYNASASTINLAGYYLSDDSLNLEKWAIPSFSMAPSDYSLIYASGKNRTIAPAYYHWESAVLPSHFFDYIVPSASTPLTWMKPGFDLTGWKQGRAGFGFGDNDDATLIPLNTIAVYIRKSFTVPAGFNYREVALQVDYDDGFVAYLNGREIGRSQINGTPSWNSSAAGNHEAAIVFGGKPETIALDTALIRSLLVEGTNVFAIEVHNYGANSTDMSLIPFLSFKVSNTSSYFDKTPSSILSSVVNRLHTNFKINGEGEKIYLFNKNENKLEMVWVKDLAGGWSMGRVSDGAAEMGIFIQPTPLKANTTKAYSSVREPEPVLSAAEGYYTTSQRVSMSTSSTTAQIRYTINGSEPTSASTLYNGTPVTVSLTGVIRAACFSQADKLPSRSVTNTYFINNTGHTVPVFSVVTDHTNLYGTTGIFDHTDQEWEKPCYVEYFDTEKQKRFEQFSGIQIDGGAGGSRTHPQHSFRLEFNHGIYGEGDVDHELIPDRPERNDYKSVYLRNGSNQYLRFQFKDAMETKMMSFNNFNYYSACTPAVVYINGGYFGLYELREKLNDEFFEENYHATIDSSFHLLSLSYYYKSVLRALNGSVEEFTNDYNRFIALNPTATDFLQKADQILDIDYYTDYIIAQSWIADTDWPQNNIKIVKGDFTSHRWRFALQDLEWALNPNGWTNSSFDHINYMLTYSSGNMYIRFWQQLMKNPTYKRNFINRFADMMNTSYLPVNTTAITQSIYDASYPEMRAEYVRWGGGESQANSQMTQYATNLAIFKSELNNRSNVVRTNMINHFGLTGKYNLELQVQPADAGVVQINTITPQVYPWTGTYFAGVPVKMEAKGSGNYVFDGWVPNSIIKDVNNPVIEADVRQSGYKFIAKFKLKAPEQAVTISEINYVTGDQFQASDWVELYNYGSASMDLTGWYITDSDPLHKWVFPGSIILPAGQRLVLASNLTKFTSVYPNVKNVIGPFDFGLGTPSDQVNIFNADNKLMASVEYSNAAPWPTGPYNKSMTLELKDPNMDLNSASNWFEGCVGGSPGEAYRKCTTGITAQAESTRASLYPNPATDQIHIVLPSGSQGMKVTCRILDSMGKQVKMVTESSVQQNSLLISVSDLLNGVYIVQLTSGKDHQALKFVKY
ncbi:MAG TPA: lamin tail domain-containing protein [Prolixibacteraceae bacterium]|nr:lamin tail domain-containing protein [Prolixibacteraceae bacterium]